MKLLSPISKGLKYTWRYQYVVVFLYLMTFLLASAVAYPLQQLLQTTVGHSMLVNDLIKGFDYTFLNDFKNAYGAGFTPILNQSLIVLGLSFLLFIFLTGGYLGLFTTQPERYDGSLFWSSAAYFFGRIFRLSIIFVFLQGGLLLGFLYTFYTTTSGFSLFELDCEHLILRNLYILSPIYLLLASILFLWQDISKIILVQEEKKWILSAIGQGLKFVFKNFFSSYFIYLLLFFLGLGLIVLNYFLSTSFAITDSTTIWYSFLLSQLFVISRLYLKLWLASSLVEWYNVVQDKSSR